MKQRQTRPLLGLSRQRLVQHLDQGDAVGTIDVDVHLEIEIFLVDFDQWLEHQYAGVVDQAVKPPTRVGDGIRRGFFERAV